METTGMVFAVVGLALTLGAAGMAIRQRLRHARWVGVIGTVIGHRTRQIIRDGRRRTRYHALVRFQSSGRELVYQSPIGNSQPRRALGAQLKLLHDPTDPEQACIDEFLEKHFASLLIGTIGVVFTGTGLWLL
jgi:Protein of unknown function (DUF3592)